MNSKEIIKLLLASGFERIHSRGSHMKLKHHDGRIVIVPHPKKDIPAGTLRNIARMSGIKLKE